MLTWHLRNTRLPALDGAPPGPVDVTVRGGVVMTVDRGQAAPSPAPVRAEVVDGRGLTLLPGFTDPHFHLLAFAKTFVTLDLGTGPAIRSIESLQQTLRSGLRQTAGTWIRARGYHEFDLAEKRHPTVRDLDAAVPDRPLVLTHRSGGAHVLNSLALERLGITGATEDPPEGIIDRDLDTGEPTGLLFNMGDWLARRLPPLEAGQLEEGVRQASRVLCARGITSLHDVSARNDLARWELIRAWQRKGILAPRVTMALGWEGFEGFQRDPAAFSPTSRLRLEGVKLILHETTGRLSPSPQELREKVLGLHRAGFPAIMHAVEEGPIEAACEAVAWALARHPGPGPRHRIEHCSVCPPALAHRIASLGIRVVTHPPFLYHHGDRYLQTVPEVQQRHLYPFGTLLREGVTVAGSSDAPISPAHPLSGIEAAITRRTARGEVLLPAERLTAGQALALYTTGAAAAIGAGMPPGLLAPGSPADLVLLSDDPAAVSAGEIHRIRVVMTWIDGVRVWGPTGGTH